MTPVIGSEVDALFEAWAGGGNPKSEPLRTADGLMSIERAARNGFRAGFIASALASALATRSSVQGVKGEG